MSSILGTPKCICMSSVSLKTLLEDGEGSVFSTSSSANISWTEGGSATAWVLKYGPAGFNVETEGTTQNISTTPAFEITGLSANTAYVPFNDFESFSNITNWLEPELYPSSAKLGDNEE